MTRGRKLITGSCKAAQVKEFVTMTNQKTNGKYLSEAFYAAGEALGHIGRACEGYRELAVQPTGFSIRVPQIRGGEYLVVIRGIDEDDTALVAFHSALDLLELVRGTEARLANGTLKWRADEYSK